MTTYDHHPTYGELVYNVLQSSSTLQTLRNPDLSRKAAKRLHEQLKQRLGASEQAYTTPTTNFLRTQVDIIKKDYADGVEIEFETIGPYLANYIDSDGVMTLDNLIPEDLIGVQLAAYFRSLFPKARLVALCDEYNEGIFGTSLEGSQPQAFKPAQKRAFLESFSKVLHEVGAIPAGATKGKEYLLQSESDHIERAEKLVAELNSSGYIEESKGALYFFNPQAENPLYRRFCLRTSNGRWLCEALEASGFLDPANRKITHLVVLPDYMKAQQDRVWEILRVLGLRPEQHHNVFFDPTQPSEAILRDVSKVFSGN